MSRRLLDQIEAVILFIGIRIGEGVESMQKSMMNIFSHVPKGIPFIGLYLLLLSKIWNGNTHMSVQRVSQNATPSFR